MKRLSDAQTAQYLAMPKLARRQFLTALGAVGAGFTLSACKGGAEEAAADATDAPITVAGGEANVLKFYNWDTYIGEDTLDNFKERANVSVKMDLFANNDEMFAKFRAGNPGYDVVVPSNEFVTRMAQSGMLMELDHSKIPNMANLADDFKDPKFDPGRKYSMPYTWLVLGIGYRKSKLADGVVPDSWKFIFDSNQYAGKISLLKESADLFRLIFKYMGKSVNGYTPELLTQAEALLIKQKPFIKNFHDDNGQDLLLSGEVDLVLEYNGDIAQKETEDDDLGFVVPKEGSLLNSDCLVIPKGAPSPNNAHAFINYLLDADVGAEITRTILYPTPNAAVRAKMDEAYRNNTTIFPPADVMAKCEYGDFQGAEVSQAFEAAMTRVQAA